MPDPINIWDLYLLQRLPYYVKCVLVGLANPFIVIIFFLYLSVILICFYFVFVLIVCLFDSEIHQSKSTLSSTDQYILTVMSTEIRS